MGDVNRILWIAGKVNILPETDEQEVPWELVGVYDDREKAVDACITDKHFIGSVKLNHTCNSEAQVFRNHEYPMYEEELSAGREK
jgi:hypothetical protein